MERRIDEDIQKLGMAGRGEFTAEEPVLGDAVVEDSKHDLDGYVAADGLMAPHEEPGEVRADFDEGLDRQSEQDIDDLNNIHS